MEWVFRSKVIHVIDHCNVDLFFDLGFDIKYRNSVFIPGYDVLDHQQSQAKSCLVLLIGGHRVIAKIDKDTLGAYHSRIYLFKPVNLQNIYEVVGDRKLPCVNRIMDYIKQFDFDPIKLKSFIPE